MRVLLRPYKNQKRSVYYSVFNVRVVYSCIIYFQCDEISLEKGETAGLFNRRPK